MNSHKYSCDAPMLRIAARLRDCFAHQAHRMEQASDLPLQPLLHACRQALQEASLAQKAQERGWGVAARNLRMRLSETLHRLSVLSAGIAPRWPQRSIPTLRELVAELTQLEAEFGHVFCPDAGSVAVETEPIELEGVYLGPFRLELHLDRLAQKADASTIKAIANDPHPAAGHRDVAHPHVQSNDACTGDATVPMANALRDGRLCDAFLALRAVLNTYNPGNAYASLEDCHGKPCADCGSVVDDDHCFSCEDCGKDYCGECFSSCEVCEDSYCSNCLERDRESEQLCCRRCRRRCGRCDRMVASDHFDQDTQLCPDCLEEHDQELETQEELEDSDEHDDEGISDPIGSRPLGPDDPTTITPVLAKLSPAQAV